jgi:hypothetical protein
MDRLRDYIDHIINTTLEKGNVIQSVSCYSFSSKTTRFLGANNRYNLREFSEVQESFCGTFG